MTHPETHEETREEFVDMTGRRGKKSLRQVWNEIRTVMSDPYIWQDMKYAMRGMQNPRFERQRRLENAVRRVKVY